MKTRKARGQVRRFFRRGIACLLALTGVAMAAVNAGVPLDWLGNLAAIPTASAAQEIPSSDEPVPLLQRLLLGDSALLAQWASGAGDTAPQAHPEEGEAEAELQQVSPDQIQEKTISGGGTGYVNAQGISLFNRTSKTVDLEAVAQSGSSLTFQPAEAGPQVLIVHTHATEAYAQDSQNPYAETGVARTTDTNYNIIRVGDEIARIFQEMGIAVIHDKTLHDSPSYNDAYDNARTGIEGYLEQYPTIQMVLDIHRDALVDSDGTVYKPVLQIDGVKTAQVMLLVGTDDAGATFPDWTEHLALAMEIQQEMNSLWPGLARPITLRTARFNQQLTKGSLLVEVGSHGNTLEEALAGARLFARSAAKVLWGRDPFRRTAPVTPPPLRSQGKRLGSVSLSPPASRQRADNKTPSPGLESQRRGLGGRDLPPSCSFPHTALRKGGAAWQGGCLRAPRPLAVPNGRRPWGWSPRLGGGRFSLPFRGRAFVCRVICGLLRLGRFLR